MGEGRKLKVLQQRVEAVSALEPGVESLSTSAPSAETASTRCWRTLTFRPSPILNIFVSKFAKTSYLVE